MDRPPPVGGAPSPGTLEYGGAKLPTGFAHNHIASATAGFQMSDINDLRMYGTSHTRYGQPDTALSSELVEPSGWGNPRSYLVALILGAFIMVVAGGLWTHPQALSL